MNREQRRKMTKAEKRNMNSKRDYIVTGIHQVPINQLMHDDNLKECDPDITRLYSKVFEWRDNDSIKNERSKGFLMSAMAYLDALCSLRFDITPIEDRVLIRNTMYHISNMANYFIGVCSDGEDMSISDKAQAAHENGDMNVHFAITENAELYEMYPLPRIDAIDDMYASFVVEHAYELATYLTQAKPSDIQGDETYVFEVVGMVLAKTKKLCQEASVKSELFAIKM